MGTCEKSNDEQNNQNNPILSLPKCDCLFCSETNPEIKTAKMFLINRCEIPLDKLDIHGDLNKFFIGWRQNCYNGPPGYLKNFMPPEGWTAIGINVLGKYDNGDNTWLGTKNKDGEWYTGYHGIRDQDAVYGILMNGFKIGYRHAHKYDYNTNPLTRIYHMQCDEGVYFTPEINEANSYTGVIKYNEYNLRIVFMCRINPLKVRIAYLGGNKEYWLTNGTTDEVRPYRILFKIEQNIFY